MAVTLYDRIGASYDATRGTDPRIAAHIWAALGDARTVLNVGAGSGHYEPPDREVTAVEPSETMIAQRPPGAAPCVQGVAEDLPFADGAFDAAMTVLSDHHWSDWRAGYAEMRRVARRVVIFTFEPGFMERAWIHEYVPLAVDEAPPLHERAAVIGAEILPVPVPHDCRDGFFHAYWRRPHAYLDPVVRANISVFAKVDAAEGIERLRADLDSGEWERRHGHLLALDELECGYRLLVAGPR
jgi:SAM-dependent methyltransferase